MKAPGETPVDWERTGNLRQPFRAQVDGQTWIVQIAEFPEEPLYTLIIDGVAVGTFSGWPTAWTRQPL